jgi:hypothetical protein
MRLRNSKWLLAAGLAAAGFLAWCSYAEWRQWWLRHQFHVEGLNLALPSQVYVLPSREINRQPAEAGENPAMSGDNSGRWLEFDIPHGTPLIRLISNASLQSRVASFQSPVPSLKSWPYAIEYQLLGPQGRVLKTGVYHFKGEQLVFLDQKTGQPIEVNFYLDRSLRPLGGRRFMLNLAEPPREINEFALRGSVTGAADPASAPPASPDISQADARWLRVRLHSSHPDLLEVAVRVHFQGRVPERKVGYLWNRLSDDQKRDLARGNVYSFEGLNEEEKRGLLRYRWAAAAPEGIPGPDFQRRTLFIRDDSENLRRHQEWEPMGIPLDAGHRAVLPLTNAGMTLVQLAIDQSEVSSLPKAECGRQKAECGMASAECATHWQRSALPLPHTRLWQGERRRVATNQFTWSGTNQFVVSSDHEGILEVSLPREISRQPTEADFEEEGKMKDGGWQPRGRDLEFSNLDLRSAIDSRGESRPVNLRAFQIAPGQTNEITPNPVHLLTFTASPTNAVEYAVDHAGSEPTLFRVDLRRSALPERDAPPASGVVHYELLANHVVQAGDVTLTNGLSAYDWGVTANGLTNVTEPHSLCFILPPTIRALRISSPQETILVNAYSRPSQLVKKVLIPEDHSPARSMNPGQPSWFAVRPPDHRQRQDAAQCSLVRVQPRPPETDPLVAAGLYEWESFLPDSPREINQQPAEAGENSAISGGEETHGQMILLPLPEGQPSRPGSQPFSFFSMNIGAEQPLRFQGEAWEQSVAPSLMLVADGESRGTATITLNGQTLFNSPLLSPVTQIRLGNLTVGEQRISVRADQPLTAYVNYLEPATSAAYLQRFCLRASTNVLRFPYVKRQAGEEMLVLRIFSPVETNPQPFEVRVKLKPSAPRGLGPFSEVTLLEREARVVPGANGRTRLVAAASAHLDDGRPLFVIVGSDFPPGRHELEVAMGSADSGNRWLTLSRTTPGLAEKLRLTSERRVD